MALDPFKKARKSQRVPRIAIAGTTGSGKTLLALSIARALSDKVCAIDTEGSSMASYEGEMDLGGNKIAFNSIEMAPPYDPDRFTQLINQAPELGYGSMIVDSGTHAWEGEGGVLSIVDAEASKYQSNISALGWRVGTPKHNRFLQSIIRTKIPLIVTLRSKEDISIEKDDKGKTKVIKLPLAPIQRERFVNEFDLYLEVDQEHNIKVSKARAMSSLDNKVFNKDEFNLFIDALIEEIGKGISQEEIEEERMSEQVEQVDLLILAKKAKELKVDKTAVLSQCQSLFNKTPDQLTKKQMKELMSSLFKGE